jgi:hypothetical protein
VSAEKFDPSSGMRSLTQKRCVFSPERLWGLQRSVRVASGSLNIRGTLYKEDMSQ